MHEVTIEWRYNGGDVGECKEASRRSRARVCGMEELGWRAVQFECASSCIDRHGWRSAHACVYYEYAELGDHNLTLILNFLVAA